MDFGQWCSPHCCTGCKCNVILPWVQEACLIDECKGKKCDSTEYEFVSKSVSASESHKAKPMLDEFWLWLILLILKEREDVEGATECVRATQRVSNRPPKQLCREKKKITWASESLLFVFPLLSSCLFLREMFPFVQRSLSLVFIFCCLLLCLFVVCL